MHTIFAILKEACMDRSSPSMDPSHFMLSPPPPDGSPDTFPSLFLYLLNIFAKAVIAQFIDEAGVAPKAADPVGVVAVQIFASNDFRFRGASLIDILVAKFRIVCPVLWGVYGNEKTEEGRAKLGWQ